MVSSFYSCNETKQKYYLKERKKQEVNDYNQQEIVDAALEEELGLETQATNLSKLAKRVVSKAIEPILEKAGVSEDKLLSNIVSAAKSGFDIFKNAVSNGKLDELVKSWYTIPKKDLTKKEKIILEDLKKDDTKKIINDLIGEIITNIEMSEEDKTRAIAETITGTVEDATSLTEKSTRGRKKGITNKVSKMKKNLTELISNRKLDSFNASNARKLIKQIEQGKEPDIDTYQKIVESI